MTESTSQIAALSDVILSEKDIDATYQELSNLEVPLDPDPLAFGPKRLNNKIAEVRKMLARCERIFLDVAQRLHSCKRGHTIAKMTLELDKKTLFANDPHVRAGRSVSDREAVAYDKLKVQIKDEHETLLASEDLAAVLVVVKAKRSDLRDTQSRLRDQIRLCQEEIGLGQRWGSKHPNAPELTPGLQHSAGDGEEVEDLLAGVEGEIHLAQKSGEWPEEPEADEPSEPSEPSDEPEVSEAVSAEPVGDLLDEAPEPESETLEKGLAGTVEQKSVEDFLDGDAVPPPKKAGETTPPPMDENALDDLLESFE